MPEQATVNPKLLVATHNQGKVREYRALLADLPLEVTWLDAEGVTFEAAETGQTFAENARMKARAYAAHTGLLTWADDSGLEVDALGGRPGLYTARYAPSVPERWAKLLGELKEVPWEGRTARFVCAIALARPGREPVTVEGECRGLITFEPQGSGGFGYDPLFFLPEYNCTMAELPDDVKNRVSHRGRAVLKAREVLRGWIEG